jgi:hypothetical protein
MTTNTMIYCYGIVAHRVDAGIGLGSKPAYVIPFQDIFAVVSDVPEDVFSQERIDMNIKNMDWLVEHGQIHERIVNTVMEMTTIIPMKFCTILKTKALVEHMLEEKYADFKYNLSHLHNMAEIGVKVYFDPALVRSNIMEASAELKHREAEAAQQKPGAAYLIRQKTSALLKQRIGQQLATDKKSIFLKIQPSAREARQNDLLSKELTGKDMLLNAVFLVKKNEVEQFKNSVAQIQSEYTGMDFDVLGPFSPYNFIA